MHTFTYACTRTKTLIHSLVLSIVHFRFFHFFSLFLCLFHPCSLILSFSPTYKQYMHTYARTHPRTHACTPTHTHTREHTRTLSPLMSLLNTLSANTSSSFSLSSHCSALARWHDFDFGLSLKFQTNSAEAIDSNLNINRLTQF